MLLEHLVVLTFALGVSAQNFAAKEIPLKGDNGEAGGIFSLRPGAKRPSQQAGASAFSPGKDSPKTSVMDDKTPGSGPYPAAYFTDPSLPKHTIYAPKNPPKDQKLPVVLWGNGGCAAVGTLYQSFLREIASHGFIVLANGSPTGWADPQTKMIQMTQSLDWVMKGGANGKFGEPDSSKIASSGQSCGGLEAYAAAYHDERVKTAIICNSGVLDDEKAYLLQEFKVPIVYFIGGPKDIAYKNAMRDFQYLSQKGLPTVMANLDTGHMGAFMDKYGGKSGKIMVAYLKWFFKDDQEAKKQFFDPQSELAKIGWKIEAKNWK